MRRVYLGVDTCTPFLSLALWSPAEGDLAETAQLVEREHASRLVAALEALLAAAGVAKRELTGIAAGAGPGSYTGLRVGGAAALGLGRALGVPVRGCDTLAALAFAGLPDGAEGLALLDARRGNVYVGRYRREGQTIVTLEPPAKRARSELLPPGEGTRIVEGIAPSAGYIARQAATETPYIPLYL